MLLAIETSCDETAVALLDRAKPVLEYTSFSDLIRADLISSQATLHMPYGGVVPELASREHVKNLRPLVEEALRIAGVSASELSAVACTRGPGLKGCLLVGLSFAKAFAATQRIPLLPIHHIEGHLFAAELATPGARPELPSLSLVVSGGHTLLVLQRAFREYRLLASTRDDAAGEAFDKTASLLGLPYPGGPALAMKANTGDAKRFKLPIGMMSDPSAFSFSGLKTAVFRLVQQLEQSSGALDEQTVCDIAASVQGAIVDALIRKTKEAIRAEKPRSFVLTGGVAANDALREALAKEMQKRAIKFFVPSKRWCTDNAAMIGVLALRTLEEDRERFCEPRWNSSMQLGPDAPFDIGALPRWPLIEELA